MKKKFLWLAALMLFLISAITVLSFFGPAPVPVELHPLILRAPGEQDISLSVEWADTEESRAYGLMNRPRVDHGMLFIFDEETPLTFWMKNTLVPLDILFFDGAGRYVSSASMEPCHTDPCAVYPSSGPARYALEMQKGFLLEHQFSKNWEIVR